MSGRADVFVRGGTVATAEFRLIGAMQLVVDGAPAKLPGAAERGLLAVLLLSAGRTVAASSLVDRLWSEEALPADPLNALQLRVSKLRRALAAYDLDVVAREAAGYRADVDPESVDVHRFAARIRTARAEVAAHGVTPTALAAYDEALALWRGDPLADFAGLPWATVEAARLTQLRLAALTERAEAGLALGRHVEVVADLQPVVADDPKQEALAGLLMTALYRAGRQADALDVYARTRVVLDEELGLQPSAALRALHQRVLRQDPALAAAPAPPPKAEVRAEPAARSVALPVAVPLIGRDAENDAVADLLARARLVTLVGPGGAGKTSLAYAVAHRVAGRYESVAVAALAGTDDAADVPLAVADAVGMPLDAANANQHVRDRLLSYLANRRVLLVLDNCEHVVDAAARLADAVLGAAPGVTVLATSREALAVPGEVQVPVGPLAAPPPGTPPERLLDYPAARLFVERARGVRPDLDLDAAAAVAVATICASLDGMPLALELAAARVSSLSPTELAERLRDRFALLTTGPRTAEARQRTLRATVEWSHTLLTEPEQLVFRRLAVFQDGWTLAAAEAVASGDGIARADVLDLLGQLVGRSMVVTEAGHPTRYRMLETLRQYAVERLADSPDAESAARRHAAYFRAVADEAETSMRGSRQRETLRALRADNANLRAALGWLAAHDRVEDALHLAGALGLYWHLGRHVEGREVLRRLVELPGGSPRARARALQAVSLVERPQACLVHPSPRCAETAAESLTLFEQLGDAHRAAVSRVLLAVEWVDGSNPEEFARLLAEAEDQFGAEGDEWGRAVVAFARLEAYLRAGDEPRSRATGWAAADAFRTLDDPWGQSAVLYHFGWGLLEFGCYAEAVVVLEQAIEVGTEAGLYNTVQWALADRGLALLSLGEVDAAAESFDRASAASEEIGDRAGHVRATHGRAVMAQAIGDCRTARALFADAAAGFRTLDTPRTLGYAIAGVAWCDVEEGLTDAAAERYAEVRRLGETGGDQGLVAVALEGLARVASLRGDADAAAELADQAAAIRRASGRPVPPYLRAGLSAGRA